MPKYLNYVTGDLCCTRQLVSKKPKQDKFPGTCVCKDILTCLYYSCKDGSCISMDNRYAARK